MLFEAVEALLLYVGLHAHRLALALERRNPVSELAELRIGQRVEVYADTYGSRRVFRGRITGFTYGTGSTLALLPPQNATGNFVKVVQRLPVRIELDDYDPDADTLFAGLSVTPYVYVKEPPTGPNAGRRLQDVARPAAPAGAAP